MAAEKRELTILNCDLVGSTMLAEELDPEVFEVIIQSFIGLSIEIVERNHGVFAINTGDGYEAYFYPGTGSPAAIYAIECGLDIQRSLESLNAESPHRIAARVGIATGQVVLSPHKLSSDAEELIAFGRPAHLAARLQQAGEASTVYVDDETQSSAERFFNFTNVGHQVLKGFNKPVGLWRVGSHRKWESRFEARLSTLSPLVGRIKEIFLLTERWAESEQGNGQALVVVGEPGIGKSRLVYEVCNRIEQKPIILQCLENHENTALHPWTRLLESAADIRPRDSVDQRIQKLELALSEHLPLSPEHSRMLLSLMVYSPEFIEADQSPKPKLEELCNAIVEVFLEFGKTNTQLLVVEDIHWIDPSSRMLLDILVDRIESAKIFILITSRPEHLEYLSNPNYTRVPLNRLTHGQTMKLAMSEMEGVLKERVEEIVQWTDGIPLYVEEMAKNSVESEIGLSRAGPIELGAGPFRPSIPNSLQQPLLARLDRLGEVKQVAQIASVIGREFDLETVSLLMGDDTDTLESDLTALVEAGIIIIREAGRDSYSFKHALIQDVVYKNLLDRDAIALHQRLTEIYQKEFPDMRGSRPEIIAYHLSLAREWENAAQVWLEAGMAAKDTGSHPEAKGRLERGLEAVDKLGNTVSAKRLKARIQMILGQVISAHFGPVNRAGHEAFEDAVAIGEELEDSDCVVSAQTSLMWLKFDAGEFNVTQSAAGKLTEYAKLAGNHQAAAVGLLGSGMCSFAMGQFDQARKSLEESLDYLRYKIDPVEGYPGKAYTYLGLISHITGDPEAAFDLCNHAINISADQGDYDVAAALGNSLYLNVMQHDLEHMEVTSNRLIALARKTGFVKWYYQGFFFLGSVYAARKDVAGLEMMEEAVDRFEQSQELVELSIFYALLAERYLINNKFKQALHWVEKGLGLVENYGECFVEAPMLRLRARCLQSSGVNQPEQINDLLVKANQVANEQGAKAWQIPAFSTPIPAEICGSLSNFP